MQIDVTIKNPIARIRSTGGHKTGENEKNDIYEIFNFTVDIFITLVVQFGVQFQGCDFSINQRTKINILKTKPSFIQT